MGLRCQLNIFEDWGFPEETSWGGGITINYSDVIAQYAYLIYKSMLDKVPVDTGNLRHSINWHSDNSGFVIETECEYAEFVEYGTCYMGEQPYFEPAIEEYAEQLFEALKPVYVEAQSEALRSDLLKEERKAKRAHHSGGGFGEVRSRSSQPKIAIYYPNTGPFQMTPSGKITAHSHQMSDPSRYREGTTMRAYAEKIQSERYKYFNASGQAHRQYVPRVVEMRNGRFDVPYDSSKDGIFSTDNGFMSTKGKYVNDETGFSSGGGGDFLSTVLSVGLSGDRLFDLSLSTGALVGAKLLETGVSLLNIIESAVAGLTITILLYLLLYSLRDVLEGEDPGDKIIYTQLEVEII